MKNYLWISSKRSLKSKDEKTPRPKAGATPVIGMFSFGFSLFLSLYRFGARRKLDKYSALMTDSSMIHIAGLPVSAMNDPGSVDSRK
jgi:hypothetical protein